MKIASLKSTLALIAAALALPLAPLSAHEGPDGHAEGEESVKGHDSLTTTPTPPTLEDAWFSAKALVRQIDSAVEEGELEKIHGRQEKLVGALKHMRTFGNVKDKARFEAAIKNAILASEQLHTAADANDKDKVEAAMKTLETTMAMLEKQVPEKK